MYRRILDLAKLLKKKSFFLFGPRGTGKTTLIQHSLPGATVIDLLEIRTYREYLKNPIRTTGFFESSLHMLIL